MAVKKELSDNLAEKKNVFSVRITRGFCIVIVFSNCRFFDCVCLFNITGRFDLRKRPALSWAKTKAKTRNRSRRKRKLSLLVQ